MGQRPPGRAAGISGKPSAPSKAVPGALLPAAARLTVHVVPFTEIQEELRRACPEELFTVLMRRFMMRIAQRVARKIGAFEASILPYEDCCTVFTHRHPRLRPVLGELEAAEAVLDVEALVDRAVAGIKRVKVG